MGGCCPERKAKGQKLLLFTRIPRYSSHVDEIDAQEEIDAFPIAPAVTVCDILFTVASLLSYVADLISDGVVAWYHWSHGRFLEACLILGFAVIPSILLNILSLGWWIEDLRVKNEEGRKLKCSLSLIFRCIASLFQLGPVLFYLDSLNFALKFRYRSEKVTKLEMKRFYLNMLEADRDATLLRLFEAFLEAAPQLMVQSYLIGQALMNPQNDEQLWLQYISVLFSLISLSWALVSQHRCLRFARDDKHNIGLIGSICQFFWRFFTIASRVFALTLFVLCFRLWIVIFVLIHYLISLLYLELCQHIDLSGHFCLESIVLLIAAFVHIFTPFNMTEGITRYRYIWCYCLEFSENSILLVICYMAAYTKFPFTLEIIVISFCCFIVGIGFCALYYLCFHPNLLNSNKCIVCEENGNVEKNETCTNEITAL